MSTLRAASTPVAGAAVTNPTATPTLPAGTATGDRVYVCVASKPAGTTPTLSANGTGWTQLTTINPTGIVQNTIWWRDKDATWSTMPTVQVTGTTTTAALIVGAIAYTPAAGATLNQSFTSGVDNTSGTGYSAIGSSNLNLLAGDCLCAFASTSGNTTSSAQGLAAAGSFSSAAVESADLGTANGPDVGYKITTTNITGGSSTSAPTHTLTLNGSNVGSTIFLRVYDVFTPPVIDAGPNANTTVGEAFMRAMSATNAPTSYAWTIFSGPAGVGNTIGTAAALNWTPSVTGTYVLQAAASNPGGAGTPDTVTITVVAASLYDPTSVSGLLHRIRPSNLALVNNDAVASLPELVGGLTLINATSTARPAYLASGLGGRPALRFDGVDDELYSSSNMTAHSQPLTIVLIYRPNDNTFGQENLLHLGGIEMLHDAGEQPQLYAGGLLQASSGGGAWLTSGAVVSGVASGANSALYGNGANIGTGDPGTGGITLSEFTLGNHQSNSDRNFTGDIYEVLIYDHVLSGTERATVHSYAQDTYGMTVSDYGQTAVDTTKFFLGAM